MIQNIYFDGWSIHKVWMGNFNEKKADIILCGFKKWLKSYLKAKILHTDNGGEFRNKARENNVDHITGGPSNLQH